MTRHFGLVGKSLSHSFSKRYFDDKFTENGLDGSYSLFELPDIALLPCLLDAHPQLAGFNVTIPYKQLIMPYLDTLSDEAAAIGAVNTVRVERNGTARKLVGFNTDVVGFANSLQGQPLPPAALVLGTGGAAAAVSYALKRLLVPYRFVSRTKRHDVLTYSELSEDTLQAYPFVINCTPLGTAFGMENQKPPLPYNGLSEYNFLYDLVYNPPVTRFLQEGKQHGARIQNGLQMLHLQAEASWQIWNCL